MSILLAKGNFEEEIKLGQGEMSDQQNCTRLIFPSLEVTVMELTKNIKEWQQVTGSSQFCIGSSEINFGKTGTSLVENADTFQKVQKRNVVEIQDSIINATLPSCRKSRNYAAFMKCIVDLLNSIWSQESEVIDEYFLLHSWAHLFLGEGSFSFIDNLN